MEHSTSDLLPAETGSADETRALGSAFGATLRAGCVVALFGKLGSGKTQFVKGICRARGIEENRVASPTFTIVHEYDAPIPIYHLDLYRISETQEALSLGLEEYLDSDGICLIEWPDVLADYLPGDAIRLRFSHVSADLRRIERV